MAKLAPGWLRHTHTHIYIYIYVNKYIHIDYDSIIILSLLFHETREVIHILVPKKSIDTFALYFCRQDGPIMLSKKNLYVSTKKKGSQVAMNPQQPLENIGVF